MNTPHSTAPVDMAGIISVPEICALPARTLAGLIKTRKLSARETLIAFLDHIESLNPRFNAIVSLQPREALLAQADAADQATAGGETLGALHGLPMAVKDTTDTKGIRTTYGSPLFAEHVPKADGLVAARQRQAGAIFIGKTNVPEFALGSHSFNTLFGATANAWDEAVTAGGSSGGAAVAIALRMLPFADGSDLGGSLRNPAAYNNILGFRPSFGRVPHWPRTETFLDQLSTEGPLARSADDLALLFSVQAGADARVPLSLTEPVADWADKLATNLRGRKIGWLGNLGGHLAFEPGILELCEAALGSFNQAGLEVSALTPAFNWESLWRAFVVLRQFGFSHVHGRHYENPARREQLKPEMQWELSQSRGLTIADMQQALITRTAWFDTALALFETYDYLAIPSAQVFPFAIATRWPHEIAGRQMDSYHRWMEVAALATLLGCPAISLPVGMNASGHPMGMQIIGRPRADLSVLQLTSLYETISSFLRATPPAIKL